MIYFIRAGGEIFLNGNSRQAILYAVMPKAQISSLSLFGLPLNRSGEIKAKVPEKKPEVVSILTVASIYLESPKSVSFRICVRCISEINMLAGFKSLC